MSATHPTWFPNPSTREEVFKNGLHWWSCRRDLAQTDEATPFCARTALAKKWHSPLWVNMYYERTLEPYREDLWRHALGGGRINFHPIYPAPANVPPDHLTTSLLGDKLLAADCRVTVEAGLTLGWERFAGTQGLSLGIDTFGESAPAPALFKHFGITTEAVVAAVKGVL